MKTADELRESRDFLSRLETNELILRGSGKDVTQRDLAIERREVDRLERTLARARKD